MARSRNNPDSPSRSPIRSMTGYGRGTAESDGVRIVVEIRSVNYRHADVRLRLPDGLAAQAGMLRRKVLLRIHRGRVDVAVGSEAPGDAPGAPVLNRSLAEAVVAAARELNESCGVRGEIDPGVVLSVPGILQASPPSGAWGPERGALLDSALEQGLSDFDADRGREGTLLREDLQRRLESMQGLAVRLRQRAETVPETLRQRLTDRLRALGDTVALDPARLAQEVVFLADRADVTEELVRLEGHLEQARDLIRAGEGPLGKRLDFLLQEVHRETNTVNSKSADLELSRLAIDIKVESEKVREQIQNLE